ncbi:MAG: DUF547 domain-containing protein [Acidobacteria bacterium]|nr:DUF547 domain-containing protein [Acidobacteriota bacterium]
MPDNPIPGGRSDRAEARRKASVRVCIAVAAALLGVLGAALFAGTGKEPTAGQPDGRAPHISDPQSPFDHEHRSWTAILAQYVSDGSVDYRGLAYRGRPVLDAYLSALSAASPAESGWTREERLAFWMNAYNAFTIRLILDHYPLPSIRSIGVLPLAAFRTKFIPLGAGRTPISLNVIENEILRKQLQDARIHFAIVCASQSCPALRSEAYRSSVVDRQLDEAARAFLDDPSKNRWDPASRTLYLSSIFKWFRDDFERAGGTLLAFVGRYLPRPVAADLEKGRVRIVFLNYDWFLNGR